MRRIDELHLAHPFKGARLLRDTVNREGFIVGRRHVSALKARRGKASGSVRETRDSIACYLSLNKAIRSHSSLGKPTPDEYYLKTLTALPKAASPQKDVRLGHGRK